MSSFKGSYFQNVTLFSEPSLSRADRRRPGLYQDKYNKLMPLGRSASLFLLATAACAQTPPDGTEQAKIISALRAYAEAYTSNLPNFICSQITKREVLFAASDTSSVRESSPGRGNFSVIRAGPARSADTFEEQLGYFDHRENYQLLKVDGKKQKPGQPRPDAG